jgi:very-short-patch-repair endonuclease
VTRKQIGVLVRSGIAERVHPDTYRLTVVAPSSEQALHAALLWGGEGAAAAAGRSAGSLYELDGVRAWVPEIVVPRDMRYRCAGVVVHRSDDRAALMVRRHRGYAVTGIEPTLLSLATSLGDDALERACEDARRRRLTSVPALHAYLERFGTPGRAGVTRLRDLVDQLDPKFAARSTLEVRTRRLLVANGLTDFVREFPLQWGGRTYLFDFGFERTRTILETNGRRWHDDPLDYESDNEKWSVPARHGYRIVFATWHMVTRRPEQLVNDLRTAMADASVLVAP